MDRGSNYEREMKQQSKANTEKKAQVFSALYGDCQERAFEQTVLQETPESDLQALWQGLILPTTQNTVEGHPFRIIAPGWWNKLKGPDFINAQIEFNGKLITGDVEIHRHNRDWFHHGHHEDPAYNNVVLHAVETEGTPAAVTQSGRSVPTWVFPPTSQGDLNLKRQISRQQCGECAKSYAFRNPALLEHFLDIAGDWRIREKERRIRKRAEEVGFDQAVYERVLESCGYSAFKKEFELLGKALPYERALQLGREDKMALEAAYLRLGGFLPAEWMVPDTKAPLHFARLVQAYEQYLHPMESLGINWKKQAVRPANRPERRLAGMAGFMCKVTDRGLERQLDFLWRQPVSVRERIDNFCALFGKNLSYWANHYTWGGKELGKANAVLGEGRTHSILGNIFVPAGLFLARQDAAGSLLENNVHELFRTMKAEPRNSVYESMLKWIVPPGVKIKMNFRRQQGLLQLSADWCERNPSCHNCILPVFLQVIDEGAYQSVFDTGLL